MLMVILMMAKDLFGNRGKSRLETTVWAIQLVVLLAGIISIVLVLKTAVIPYSFSKVSTLPQLWKFWLSPPYIYIIINFIIVFIAVSSTFHHPRVNEEDEDNEYADPRLRQYNDGDLRHPVSTAIESPEIDNDGDVDFLYPHQTCEQSSEETTFEKAQEHIPSSPEHIKHILVTDKSVTSKGHEEEEEDYETMEATWEAIIEARKSPQRKELKKIETWNASAVVVARQRGGVRRDVSIGHAELNSRVEAFITKFNMDMRLQRQESDQRFLDMMNR